jgi:hypothetical protein
MVSVREVARSRVERQGSPVPKVPGAPARSGDHVGWVAYLHTVGPSHALRPHQGEAPPARRCLANGSDHGRDRASRLVERRGRTDGRTPCRAREVLAGRVACSPGDGGIRGEIETIEPPPHPGVVRRTEREGVEELRTPRTHRFRPVGARPTDPGRHRRMREAAPRASVVVSARIKARSDPIPRTATHRLSAHAASGWEFVPRERQCAGRGRPDPFRRRPRPPGRGLGARAW